MDDRVHHRLPVGVVAQGLPHLFVGKDIGGRKVEHHASVVGSGDLIDGGVRALFFQLLHLAGLHVGQVHLAGGKLEGPDVVVGQVGEDDVLDLGLVAIVVVKPGQYQLGVGLIADEPVGAAAHGVLVEGGGVDILPLLEAVGGDDTDGQLIQQGREGLLQGDLQGGAVHLLHFVHQAEVLRRAELV